MEHWVLEKYQGSSNNGGVGWCDGPGETFSAGASYNLGDSRARPIALAVSVDGGCLDICFHSSILSSLFPLSGDVGDGPM